ncbi:putative 5'(3')-deoxyribonucleotidase [Salmonella phage Sajous1]|nr:putative 5'(3')-deoxyribonucleotidase [Salmonella phage Sajous1]
MTMWRNLMNNHVGLYDACSKIGGLYRVLVDVDLTLVDSLSPWVEWFNISNSKAAAENMGCHDYPSEFQPITKECYMSHAGDLAILMRERAHPAWLTRRVFVAGQWMDSPTGRDPMDWWRMPDLYSRMSPLPGAVEFLTNLKAALLQKFEQVEMVAVTKCEPEHERSKRQFTYHHFESLINGFVSTDEKHLLAGDVLIDDNPKYVEPCALNNIFVIFVPQGNYEKLDLSNCEDMLYIKHVEGQNHFDFLNRNLDEVVNRLVSHYQYVR